MGGLSADFFYVGEGEATYTAWKPFIKSIVKEASSFIYSKSPQFKTPKKGDNWLYVEAKDKDGVENVQFNTQMVEKLAKSLNGYRRDPKHAIYDMKSGLIQMWQFGKCKKLVEAAENRGSLKYKRFARVRTDVLLRPQKQMNDLREFKKSMSKFLAFNEEEVDDLNARSPIFTVSDFIFMIPRGIMAQILGSLSALHTDLLNGVQNKQNFGPVAGSLTQFWLASFKERAARLQWIDNGFESALLRSANYPLNCFHVDVQDAQEHGENENTESIEEWGLPSKSVAVGCFGLTPTIAERCEIGACMLDAYRRVRKECQRSFGMYEHG
jgi:hypothetical protein